LAAGLDDALRLLTDPRGFYLEASHAVQRLLLLAVFEKIWIIEDAVVGADLTRPFAELLTVDPFLAAGEAVTGTEGAAMTYERRQPMGLAPSDVRQYLRIERPRRSVANRQNEPQPRAEVRVSNIVPLLGVAGFEPRPLRPELRAAPLVRCRL